MLWDKVKHLKNLCPIYINVMEEDENDIPANYVILEDDSYDDTFLNGDGINLFRKKSFNIRIFCNGLTISKEIVSAFRKVLIENKIPFRQTGPVYETMDNTTSILISGSYIYET